MSTNDYLDSLTIDQLRYARDEADKRIKKAESKPKKLVWIVSNGLSNVSWHREEDYEKALESFTKVITEDKWTKRAFTDTITDRHSIYDFKQSLPTIDALYQNETEYEEWFK